jgi:two-component system, cell cycle response regulator
MANPAYEKLKESNALPSPTGVVLEILRLTDDENATLYSISKVVESDPALAGRTLRLINSPFAGLSRRIVSVSVAVKLLGLRAIKNLALSLSLLANNRKGCCGRFDYGAFWSESLARAVAARQIATRLRNFPPDEAFTIGLLAKIGRLGLATARQQEYARVLSSREAGDDAELARMERECFGLDHNELSAEMMAEWHLPELFYNAVRWQDAPDSACVDMDSRLGQLARLLHLAGGVALLLVQPEATAKHLSALISEADKSGISAEAFDPFIEAIAAEWRDAGAILSVTTRNAPSLAELRARTQAVAQTDEDHGTWIQPTGPAPTVNPDALRILAVDDDPIMLRLLTKHLAAAGYQVTTAANGGEALEIDRTQAPQMIITDWMMPEIDGLELCRRLRANEDAGFVYVIVLTAQSDKGKVVEALEAGADDFLAKPFSRQELLAHVRAGERIVRLENRLAERGRDIARANAQLAAANDRLRIAATTDELTGLANRREGLIRLAEHWALAERYGEPLSCIVADIDHFKGFNDSFGHPAGDAILKSIAGTLRKTSRRGDIVSRIGGEEFLIVCPMSSVAMAAQEAERLRRAVEANAVATNANQYSVTISMGVAERTTSMARPSDLLNAADGMLYAAKEAGRNRVCAAAESPGSTTTDVRRGEEGNPCCHIPVADVAGLRPTILVADDDRQNRTFCRRLLEREGYTVWEAADGLDVLEKVPQCSPDVVVLDAAMPRLDGLECTRRLKANAATRDIPIIMLSAAGEPADIETGLKAGVDEYVAKPVREREFTLRIRSMVCLRRSMAELFWSNATRWEQTRLLQVLLDFSCGLVGEESLDHVLKLIVTTASELTRSRRVSIMLPDSKREQLRIAHAIGIDDRLAAEVLVPVGEGVAGKVFLTGEQVVVNGPEEEPAHRNQYDSRFFASVPLISKALRATGRVFGVLNVTDRQGQQPFAAHELEVLNLLCNIAATAIDDLLSRLAHDEAQNSIVLGLATLAEHRDVETGTHLNRVTHYAMLLAEELRDRGVHQDVIDAEFLSALRRAMPLHDIGKVGISDHILLKPGRLTDSEITQMRQHAEIGARTIRSLRERTPGADFLRVAEEIAWGHHERWDGTGYPRGMTAQNIPLSARIAAVADVYDAITTDRVYRDALSHEQAVRIIREGAGEHFDPDIVRAFLARESQFARTAVELADAPGAKEQAEPSLVP